MRALPTIFATWTALKAIQLVLVRSMGQQFRIAIEANFLQLWRMFVISKFLLRDSDHFFQLLWRTGIDSFPQTRVQFSFLPTLTALADLLRSP